MTEKHPRPYGALTALLAALAMATGASPAVADDGFPVTIDNCGEPVVFDRAPERAVTVDINTTETMLALGLESHLAAVMGVSGYGYDLSPELAAAAARLETTPKYPGSLEIVLQANPDFVFAGWNYGFAGERGITPETLAAFGVKSYAIRESCIKVGARPPITMDDTYQDILAIGRIFGVGERAAALVGEFRRQVAEVTARVGAVARPLRVFVYDSDEKAPFTAGRMGMPNALVELAGGVNVFADVNDSWLNVGWEEVVARDPEVIVVVDYGEPSAAGKRAFLLDHPALAGVEAIHNRRFVTLPYAALVPSVHNAAAVRRLAQAFHPASF